MHAVFSNSLAALLLLHAVFGCCWHQAHASCAHGAHRADVAMATPCCGEHRHGAPAQDEAPHPAPCHGDCGATCAYLPTQKSQSDGDGAESPLTLPVLEIVKLIAPTDLAALSVDQVELCTVAIEPPLRLHLAHHVLLI